MSEQQNKDARGSQGYRNDSGYKQHQREGQTSGQSFYQSSHRPSSLSYNSSYHNNSSYRQSSSRPYNKYQQSSSKGSDRYQHNSYHSSRSDNRYETDQRKHEQSDKFNSKHSHNDSSYGRNYDFKPSPRQTYNKDTKETIKVYESSKPQSSRKHSNEQQRSRSRNKQYNKPHKEHNSHYKPYFKDSRPHDNKPSHYPQKSTQDYDKIKDQNYKSEKLQFDRSASKKSQDDYKGYKYKETNQPKHSYTKQDHSKNYYQFKNPYPTTYHKNPQPYFKEKQSFRETNKDLIDSKDVISIEVKSRIRSPKQYKNKKQRNSSLSKSKSVSRSKKSKSHSKRKHKKRNSSGSSSSSSSNSSSSSSSSSGRSSSSSSSGSSSSSNSRSVSSRSRRHSKKEHKDFYQKKSQYSRQGFYQSSYNQPYNRDRPYNQYQKPSFNSQNSIDYKVQESQKTKSSGDKQILKGTRKQQSKKDTIKGNQVSEKSLGGFEDKGSEPRQEHERKSERSERGEQVQQGQNGRETNGKIESPRKADGQQVTMGGSYNEQRYPYKREFGQRDFYKKSYNPNYQPREQYSFQKPYFNPPYIQQNFGSQNNIQPPADSSSNQLSPAQQPSNLINPALQPSNLMNPVQQPYQPYRNEDSKTFNYNQPNEFMKNYSSGYQNHERKPYFTHYQNNPYHPNHSQNYDSNKNQNFTNYPYNQKFNHYQNKPYQKNYPSNLPNQIHSQSNSNPSSIYTNPSFQTQPYHSSFPNNFRRTTSDFIPEKRPPFFTQTYDNQINRSLTFKHQTDKQDLNALQIAFQKQADLKKIHALIPSSKVLELIQKARKNLTIPAINSSFLALEVFKEMTNLKKQTMNQNLKNVLESDYHKKYQEEKKKVFQNLQLLNLESQNQEPKENHRQQTSKQSMGSKPQQNGDKMDVEQERKENPQKQKNKQFLWKRPEMSQNLRILKSNIEMMREATSRLSQMSRKMKIKFQEKSAPPSERSAIQSN